MSKKASKKSREMFDIDCIPSSNSSQDELLCTQTKKQCIADSSPISSSNSSQENKENDKVASIIKDAPDEDYNDVSEFLQTIGNEVNKSIKAKQGKFDSFSDNLLKLNFERMNQLMLKHKNEQEQLQLQFFSDFNSDVEKYVEDMKKMKNIDEQIKKLFKAQNKLIMKLNKSNNMVARLKEYSKSYKDLKMKQYSEFEKLQENLKAESTKLQQKFMADIKQKDLKAMKKSLANLI